MLSQNYNKYKSWVEIIPWAAAATSPSLNRTTTTSTKILPPTTSTNNKSSETPPNTHHPPIPSSPPNRAIPNTNQSQSTRSQRGKIKKWKARHKGRMRIRLSGYRIFKWRGVMLRGMRWIRMWIGGCRWGKRILMSGCTWGGRKRGKRLRARWACS